LKIDNIILIEPENVDNFYPFSILHPIWELRTGALKIYEKIQNEFNEINIILKGRRYHTLSFLKKNVLKSENIQGGNNLIFRANINFNDDFYNDFAAALVNYQDQSLRFTIDNKIVGAFLFEKDYVENLSDDEIIDVSGSFYTNFPSIELKSSNSINYIWDSIYNLGKSIEEDFKYFSNYVYYNPINYPNSFGINISKIRLGKNVSIAPTVVLDASSGPIVIDDNAKLMPQSTVIGPAYIGKNTIIKVGAKIYNNTVIGEHCKVGGEVEDSIIQAYTNKQHEGFLGHSFLSEWVNLGADSNTSDLKNTYSNINIRIKDKEINTGKMFLGLLCGDHTKSAINTQFNTGTVIGICGILVKDGFLPNYVPSFAWGGKKGSPIYKVEKAIAVVKKVMARRDLKLDKIDEDLIIAEHEETNL